MTDQSPLVSVIMAFLDPPEAFLREAIDSVLEQDYPAIEIIFVDDGSRGNLAESLAESYQSCAVPMRWLQHESGANEGLSASRNLGVSVSRGEYIAFLDADDVWLPGKLKEQVALMQAHPAVALMFGKTIYWREWDHHRKGKKADSVPWINIRRPAEFPPPEYLARMIRGKAIVPSSSNIIVRRGTFDRCGGFEPEFRGLYEDQVFLAKVGIKERICAVPSVWDRYRQHSESMCAKADRSAAFAARSRFLDWLIAYCEANQETSPRLYEAIAKSLWLNADYGFGPRAHHWIRWTKKWILKLEEVCLPESFRQGYWGRRLARRKAPSGAMPPD